MRTLISFALVLILAVTAVTLVPAGSMSAQDAEREAVHLVLAVNSSGAVSFNRIEWGVTAFAPLFPGTGVRANDFMDVSADTTITILCADLALVRQRGSGVPDCSTYLQDPVFRYVDDPEWLPADVGVVTVTESSPQPDEIFATGEFQVAAAGDSLLAAVTEQVSAIAALDVPDDAKAFALATYYREQGMTFDAVNALLALPEVGCQREGQTVAPPRADERPLAKLPVTYLRLGELYQELGNDDIAARYYGCAATLAETLEDPANLALASARWANIVDIATATPLYQVAIDSYAQLGARGYAETMAEFCGRDCRLPDAY